jgi:hypothetical protein
MLNADRRGHLAGADAARAWKFLQALGLLGPSFVRALGVETWIDMKAAGCAPIEPREEFLIGFSDGFTEFLVLQGASYVNGEWSPRR